MQFESGKFVALKARTKFHLGSIEKDINQGDIIYFDGETAKIGGKEHNLQQIGAAVRAGWLVPVDSAAASEPYRPQPAKMEMRPAQSTSKDRGPVIERTSTVVHEEERDLGGLKTVRDRGDGIVKRQVLAEDASSEGVPVGKLKRAAVQKTVLTAENATRVAQEINKIDNVQGSSDRLATPMKVAATGDVQEARVGDALDELLGDSAVSSEVPASGPAGEGDSPHLTVDEKAEKAKRVAASTEAARKARLAQLGAEEPKAAPEPAVATSAEEEPEQIDMLTLAGKVALIRAVIPKFEWDMTRHWKVRVADAVKTYGKNPLYLNGILSVETDAVKNYITLALAKGFGSS
jgi:hypothetical protein